MPRSSMTIFCTLGLPFSNSKKRLVKNSGSDVYVLHAFDFPLTSLRYASLSKICSSTLIASEPPSIRTLVAAARSERRKLRHAFWSAAV